MDDRLLNTSYGIDLSERHLVIVRARGRSAVETLVQAGAGRAPEGFARQISGEVTAGRAHCVGSIGCHESVLRRVSAPFPGVERALKVFPSVLDVQLPFPLEQCACVFTGFEPGATGGTDALALAARREDVQRVLQRFADAGLDAVALDHEGLALWAQSFRERPGDGESGRVVVHIGPAHSTVVYGREGRLLGAHGARLGAGDPGDPETRARTLAGRVKTWLQAQTAVAVNERTRWLFSGAGAADTGFLAALCKELQVEAARTVDDPHTYLARALALRGLAADKLACNLRTGDQAHPQSRRLADARVRSRALVALLAGLLLCAVNGAALYFAAKRNDDLQRDIQRLAAEMAGSPAPRGQETLVVRRALDERNAVFLPFQRLASPGVSTSLAGVLQALGTNRTVVSRLSLEAGALRFDARPRDAAEVEKVVLELKRAGWTLKISKTESAITVEGTR